MTPFALIFLLVNVALLWAVPRRWAPVPLLVAACYMTKGEGIEVGPFHFTIIRALIAAGVVRVVIRGEHLQGKLLKLDWFCIAWGIWYLIAALFHQLPFKFLVTSSGVAYDVVGMYFLMRILFPAGREMGDLIAMLGILLVPVGIEMVNELVTHRNFFSQFGGVPFEVAMRDGKYRAQGPFLHAILAGTVGAVCFPLMVGIWFTHRRIAIIGLVNCLAIVIASNSSGPIMTVAAGVFALGMWRYRHLTRLVRWSALFGYLVLNTIMKRPAYYLIAEIDLTGSSTGWHRARLIESSIEHLSEWWFAGTDYTRHWMATGVTWSPDHTDITNHYLDYGVDGGLLAVFLFMAMLVCSFSYFGQVMRTDPPLPHSQLFLVWCVGSSLFASVVTCVSIAFFDQSYLFLYLPMAVAASLYGSYVLEARQDQDVSEGQSAQGPEIDLGAQGTY